MHATGQVDLANVACQVAQAEGSIVAGLHPAAGGSGEQACSGDMLLQALVACSGVTLAAVATALSIPLTSVSVAAQGEMDFRGTLGVDRSAPIGFTSIALEFEMDSPASDEQLDKLITLTERYCVVLQTLAGPSELSSRWSRP